ncbi:hypothetical protein MN116_007682 [Schistosoma mekongi]|uniref:Steroid dehydrogenase n=1 Tax=Schistosoma mekongi TaxID=38744 RepID=A0AAE1Z7T2_SCHME|nr:hypothetical protein MN116_007682 [Schistosoma mekongi]
MISVFGMVWHSSSFASLLFIAIFGIYLYRLVKICFNYSIGRMLFSKRKHLKHAGEWAIVTGATDGIGKAYVEELAGDGLNIMLISRNLEKLENVAKEIESTYHVETRIVVADFTEDNIYESIEREIAKLPSVACLVNNVGMSYPYFEDYADAKFMNCKFIRDLVNCNVQSVAAMTYLVLPKLLKQAKNNSAIINIGSFLGFLPSPYVSLYGSTKAFVHHFSKSIEAEINLASSDKVIIQTVCPLFVATSMSRASRTSFFIPSARNYAKSALNMLGVEEFTMGYIAHALQGYILTSIPLSWLYDKYKKIAVKARKKYQ